MKKETKEGIGFIAFCCFVLGIITTIGTFTNTEGSQEQWTSCILTIIFFNSGLVLFYLISDKTKTTKHKKY